MPVDAGRKRQGMIYSVWTFKKSAIISRPKIKSLSLFQGVRVQVRSVYIEGRSQPSKNQYFFAYRIRITNNSNRSVQLLRRHWIITDANEKTENVWWVVFSNLYCLSLKSSYIIFFFQFVLLFLDDCMP